MGSCGTTSKSLADPAVRRCGIAVSRRRRKCQGRRPAMPVHTWDKKSGNARRARRCILLAGCQTAVSSVEAVAVIPTLCLSLPSVEAVAMIPTPRPHHYNAGVCRFRWWWKLIRAHQFQNTSSTLCLGVQGAVMCCEIDKARS